MVYVVLCVRDHYPKFNLSFKMPLPSSAYGTFDTKADAYDACLRYKRDYENGTDSTSYESARWEVVEVENPSKRSG